MSKNKKLRNELEDIITRVWLDDMSVEVALKTILKAIKDNEKKA